MRTKPMACMTLLFLGGWVENTELLAEPKDSPIVTTEQVERAQQEQYDEILGYLDRQVEEADRQRKEHWKRDFSSLEAYRRSVKPHRKELFDLLGGGQYSVSTEKPREELIAQFDTHSAWRVWIPAFEKVNVYGILLIPKGDGPFPAMVCIHGMAGTPEGVCGLTAESDYHNRFGLQAVERGYVVFAPLDMNSAQKRSWLDREAIMIGQRLQALEQFKMLRLVDYLMRRKEIDAQRIGVYGISWGGRTVMNMAALDERIAACAISGHFNDHVPKMLRPSEHYTAYIQTSEGYAFFHDHIRKFTDADEVLLICPRPVFIEQGREDRVAWWEMSQKAFREVEEAYRKLGIPERAVYSVFEGGHEVRCVEAFEFFDQWLKK